MELRISRSTMFVIFTFLFVLVVVPGLLYIASHISVLGGGANDGTAVGAIDNEKRIMRNEPVVYSNNTIDAIGIHIHNFDNTNHTVSLTIRDNGEPLWKQSHQIPPHTELEIHNLIDKKGVYTLELKTVNGESATQRVYFDQDHDYLRADIEDGNVTIDQSVSVEGL